MFLDDLLIDRWLDVQETQAKRERRNEKVCFGFVAQRFVHWISVIDPEFNAGHKSHFFFQFCPAFIEHLTVCNK